MHEQSMKCSTRNKDHNDSRGLEPTMRKKKDGGSRLKLRNFIDVKSYKKKKDSQYAAFSSPDSYTIQFSKLLLQL